MKTLVIYYSYTGNAKRLAQELAKKQAACITEIKDTKYFGKLKAYSLGCIAAMRGKSWPIQPLKEDFARYDNLIIFAPVWAGNPPPAVNSILEKLPKGKSVSFKMVSASGRSKCRERLESIVKSKGCNLKDFEDIKS